MIRYVKGWDEMDELKPPYDIATSGASTIKYAGRIEIPPLGMQKLEFNFAETFQKDERFQAWRGHIINNALFIEEKIDNIISKIFLGKNMERFEQFNSIILAREFFTFMSKWNVLRDILNSINPYKERDYIQLKTDLQKIIEVRNKFAHGKVSYSGNKGEKIILEYFSGGPKKEEINENMIKNFIELVKKCHFELDKIILELKENS